MKISYSDNKTESRPRRTEDLSEVFASFKEKYDDVFIYRMDDEIYMFKSLGRGEYKKLKEAIENPLEQEDIICEACILWPKDFNINESEAGLPSKLAQEILKASYLDSREAQLAVINYFRQEMFFLDNQITCIINEAFPHFDIEEIEKWDVAKTAKYLSRAEWKLHNLRSLPINGDPFAMNPEPEESPVQQKHISTEEIGKSNNPKKERMTPEKLQEMKMKFPEINWDQDSVVQEGINALQDSVDSVPPALRAGY